MSVLKDNMKKISVLFICLLVINVWCGSQNVQALTRDETYAGNQLRVLGVLKGYEDGSLRLENNITRAEVATMTIRILGYEGLFVVGEEKEFIDVTTKHWSYDYVQSAYKLSVINGYPDSSFKPNNNISYAEVVAIMINTLKENENLEGDWPYNYINKAIALGVIDVDKQQEPGKIVTRGEMAEIVWNTLLVKNR